jgi:hypothetical protein
LFAIPIGRQQVGNISPTAHSQSHGDPFQGSRDFLSQSYCHDVMGSELINETFFIRATQFKSNFPDRIPSGGVLIQFRFITW